MKHFCIILTIVLILASCSPAEAEIPTTVPLTPTSTIITPSQTNSPPPTATAAPTDTQEPLPTATISPSATEESGLHLSDIEGQATPEQIVELIRNGETLIPADALTDEFLDAYLQAMNYDQVTGEPVQEITVEQLEALGKQLGYLEYSTNSGVHWFLAIAHNRFAFDKDIQIFNDPTLSNIRALGLERVTWLDKETNEIKTALTLYGTQNYEYSYNGETMNLASIAGFGTIKDSETFQSSQAAKTYNILTSQLDIKDGDVIMFGVSPSVGNRPDSDLAYRSFNDDILATMYPNWETDGLPNLIKGDTNLVPIIILSELTSVASTDVNIFDQN